MSSDRILRLFPRAWRERYADEIRLLLESDHVGWRTRLDLVSACVDAWHRQAVMWGRQGAYGAWALGTVALVMFATWALGWALGVGVDALVGTQARALAPQWMTAGLWFKTPLVLLVAYSDWSHTWWASGKLHKRLVLAGVLAVLLTIMAVEAGTPDYFEALGAGWLVVVPWMSALKARVTAILERGRLARKSSAA